MRFIATSSRRLHPTLSARKQILARAVIARNLRLRPIEEKIPRSADIDALMQTALAETSTAKVKRKQQLTQFLALIKRQIDKEVKGLPGLTAKAQALIDGLKNDLRSVDCKTCALRARKNASKVSPCNGTGRDYHVMDAGMDCWKFIVELFTKLVELTERHYAPLLPPAGSDNLCVELQTVIAARSELSARTTYESDAANARVAQVELGLPAHDFSAEHLKQLPYVLFHEIFVHVAEGLMLDCPRPRTPETCAFREGYLDAAAAELLSTVLRYSPTSLPEFHGEFGRALAVATKSAHSNRGRATPDAEADTDEARNLDAIVNARQFGASVYDAVRRVLGDDGARRIGIGANVLPLNDAERAAALETLDILAQSLSSHRERLLSLQDACLSSDDDSVRKRRELLFELLAKPDI